MKLTLDSQQLLSALEVVKPVVSTNTLVPVCDNVLLKVDKESIIFASTNTHASIIHSVTCECDTEGKVLVPFRDVYNLVKTLPACPVDLFFNEDFIEIKCYTGTYNIQFTDKVTEFPKIALIENPIREVVIPSSQIPVIQDKTLKFLEPDEKLSTMHGVGIDFTDHDFDVVALQMRMMSILHMPYKSIVRAETPTLFYVQKKAIDMMGIFSYAGDVTLKFSDKKFQVSNDDTVLITNLLNENFQPYKNAIVVNPYWIVIDRKDLLKAITRAKNFSGVELIGLKVNHEKIELYADNHIKGKGLSEEYNISDTNIGEADELHFGLNVQFLIDTLNSFKSDEVKIEVKDYKSFIVLSEPGDSESFIQMAQYMVDVPLN